MTPHERAEVLVTARLLRAIGILPWLAAALTLVAVAGITHDRDLTLSLTSIFIGLIAIFYGVRVSFDARLLEDIASDRLTTEDLDSALAKFGKGNPRSWADRCRGARRLALSATVATIAQLIAVVITRWP